MQVQDEAHDNSRSPDRSPDLAQSRPFKRRRILADVYDSFLNAMWPIQGFGSKKNNLAAGPNDQGILDLERTPTKNTLLPNQPPPQAIPRYPIPTNLPFTQPLSGSLNPSSPAWLNYHGHDSAPSPSRPAKRSRSSKFSTSHTSKSTSQSSSPAKIRFEHLEEPVENQA